MRKASQILMRIGAAFAVVTVISSLIAAAILGTVGFLAAGGMIAGGLLSGSDEAASVLVSMGISYGIGFICAAVAIFCSAIFPLISAILGFIGGRKKAGKAIFIVNIVFAVFLAYNFNSGFGLVAAVLLLIGSFMGLSAVKEEKAALAEEQPVEEQK